jgi:hypothetical protein
MASRSPIYIAGSPIYSPHSPSYTPDSPALVVDSDDEEFAAGGNDAMEIPLAPTTPLRPAPEAVVAPGAPKKEVHFAAAKRSRDEDEEGGAAKRTRLPHVEPAPSQYSDPRGYAAWVQQFAGLDGLVRPMEVVAERLKYQLAGPKEETLGKWLAVAVDLAHKVDHYPRPATTAENIAYNQAVEQMGTSGRLSASKAQIRADEALCDVEHTVEQRDAVALGITELKAAQMNAGLAKMGGAGAADRLAKAMLEFEAAPSEDTWECVTTLVSGLRLDGFGMSDAHLSKCKAYNMLRTMARVVRDAVAESLMDVVMRSDAHVVRVVAGYVVPVEVCLWDSDRGTHVPENFNEEV